MLLFRAVFCYVFMVILFFNYQKNIVASGLKKLHNTKVRKPLFFAIDFEYAKNTHSIVGCSNRDTSLRDLCVLTLFPSCKMWQMRVLLAKLFVCQQKKIRFSRFLFCPQSKLGCRTLLHFDEILPS